MKIDGYKVVGSKEKADIYVINTCTVTNMSDRKSRQMLRRVKEQNKDAIVVACGCYVQVSEEELEAIKEIDIVLGNKEKADIVDYVENYKSSVEDVMHDKEFEDFGEVTYTEKTRAVIKVQDGCDRFCSYCIIPYARGRVRSRKPNSIIKEVSKLAEHIQEIVITGIHIASYGKDFKENYRLIDLLEDLNKIEGIKRIRLGSIEPLLINEEFLSRLTKLEKVCNHFHLSLQSGCNEVLKRMNRRYTIEQFEEIVELLRKAYKDVLITTDIIVGFPGETDEEFNQTYNFLNKIKLYKMHVFKYSPRKGTKAVEMPNQVEGKTKELRSKKLIELSNKNQLSYNESYIGKDLEVLIEEKKNGKFKGHTKNYVLVMCESDLDLENKIVTVSCKMAENEHVEGTVIKV